MDVSDPSNVMEVGSLATKGRAVGLAVENDHVYVADWSAGLRVIDISAPLAPIELGSFQPQIMHGARWLEATETCSQPSGYVRDLLNNRIGVSVCQTGRFALYGPTQSLFMPIVHQG